MDESRYGYRMVRSFVRCALFVLGLFCLAASARAADFENGVWRGTIIAENPHAKVTRVETTAALHVTPAGRQLFVEHIEKAVPVVELSDTGKGTFDLVTGGEPAIELRGIRLKRDGFDAAAVYENELRAPLSGRASFTRMRPLSPPSVRTDCASAPSSLSSLCGIWSGISLRGQPKLLIIDKITRNRQKIAWELKARQSWGGGDDLASAGMSFPYTEYIAEDYLPDASLPLRTTGKLAYRFGFDGTTLTGGHIGDPGDETIYVRVKP